MHPTDARPHVVIVGGGIAGLAAAFFLRDEPVRVTVLEGSPRPGGKLCVSEIAGVAVDEGAEALLVTRPEGTGLIAELGLGGERVDPGTTSSAIWTLGALHPLPRRQFMGVPSDMAELAKSGVLSGDGVARASQDLELPPTARDGDVAVARYVGARLGAEVVDRLVDPLLGGVYAGRSAELSFDATLPALATASRKYRSLAEAARSLLPPAPTLGPDDQDGRPASGGSVFTTLAGGLGTLPEFLAKASGAHVRTGAMARELSPAEGGWRLTVGSGAAPEQIDADAVILAVPAPAGQAARRRAGRLGHGRGARRDRLREHGDRHARVPALRLSGARAGGAGLERVPGSRRRRVGGQGRHLLHRQVAAPGRVPRALRAAPLEVVRCSIGRIGEEALAAASRRRARLAGRGGARGGDRGPRRQAATRVTRWGGALPQYTVGHVDRVVRIRRGSRPSRAWPSAARPMTGWAYRPASAPPARRPARSRRSSRPGADRCRMARQSGRQWWHV